MQGPSPSPSKSVTKLFGEAEQAAYEKSLHPGLLEGWKGGANVGFGLTRGNSQTKNLDIAFTADRKTLHDHLGLYTNSVYATNDAPGATPATTANAVQGGIRYDHDLTPRLFAYVGADFQTDALQTLDLRSVFGGGLGVHVIQNTRTTLDLLGGVNYTREKYSLLPSRSFAAASVGEELSHKLGANTVVTQKLYFFPNFNDTRRVPGDLQFRHGDQDQQMAGMAERVRRHLRHQSARGSQAERHSADHRPELLVHPLRRLKKREFSPQLNRERPAVLVDGSRASASYNRQVRRHIVWR